MEPHEYEDMMRRMLALIVKMDERLVVMETTIGVLRDFNQEQVKINARLETLLTRVLRNDQADDGRDA